MRHWKYCTVSDPQATACRLASRCAPGRFSLLKGCQFTRLGVLSMSMKGFCGFMPRMTAWSKAVAAAVWESGSASVWYMG